MGSQFVFLQTKAYGCTDILLLCHAVGTVSRLEHALQHARTKLPYWRAGHTGRKKRVKREDESTAWITGYLHLLCAWQASCFCTSPYLNKRELSHYYLLHNVYWQQSSISYPYGIDVPRQSLLETNRCLVLSRVRFPVVFCHQASR